MPAPLSNPTFRRLLAAQAVALTGTGLATVSLGLLAFDLAGDSAGAVLGTALAIKMVAYVTLAPLAAALAARLPRRAFLVALDLIRALVVFALPFVDQVWQIYILIFLLQAASAGFTPAFQATIPDVLPEEDDYTRGLSLMRLAEDLEQIASPLIAAALLTLVSFPVLFAGTVAGFLGSALLVGMSRLPARRPQPPEAFLATAGKGLRIYAATPRLRGLLALEAAVAAAGAMVYVNTVVLVETRLTLGAPQVALAFAAFGAGSILAALTLPRLLRLVADRPLMLTGAALMLAAVAAVPMVGALGGLLALWAVAGFGFSLTQTPIGRILSRSAHEADRPALFAAQFALSHACWLVTYPLAGWVGTWAGLAPVALILAAVGGVGFLAALWLWPAREPEALGHAHPELPATHPHLAEHGMGQGHRHRLVIDALHPHWPRAAG
jgi:MFS family permease